MILGYVAVCMLGVAIGSVLTLFIVAIVTVGSRADERMGYDR